jgi:predicted RNA-binding protein YlxR (DUF448 family)/ribosomal protein L7Ae-like RNA K-turn-binding protein
MSEVEAVENKLPTDTRTRTCVGCGEQVARDATGDLVRLVLGQVVDGGAETPPNPPGAAGHAQERSPQFEIAVDARGGGFGRGAHVHARRACLERAVKGGLARSAKARVERIAGPDDATASPLRVESLALAIQAAMDRRIEGLLAAAVRSRQLARGADAVTGACHREEAALVLVARDAAAAADLTEVRRAVAEGRGVAWGTKEELARLVAPGGGAQAAGAGVGVVAVLSARIAGALREAAHTAAACAEIACAPAAEGGQRRSGRKAAPPRTAARSSH